MWEYMAHSLFKILVLSTPLLQFQLDFHKKISLNNDLLLSSCQNPDKTKVDKKCS